MENELNKTEATEQVESKEKETVTMTKDELDLLLQQTGDKRISQYQKTMERKQREAEKLKNMSETDKREYELQQREDAIAAKELELSRAENKAEGTSILAEKGISTKLIELVIADDAEAMYENIKVLEREFKNSVKAEVEKRLASKVPTKSLPVSTVLTKKDLVKMSLAEMQRLKAEQPELYDELTK